MQMLIVKYRIISNVNLNQIKLFLFQLFTYFCFQPTANCILIIFVDEMSYWWRIMLSSRSMCFQLPTEVHCDRSTPPTYERVAIENTANAGARAQFTRIFIVYNTEK